MARLLSPRFILTRGTYMGNANYYDAFVELRRIGAKAKRTSAGESIRLSRSLNGQWFLCELNGYHLESVRKYLCLDTVPNLRNALIQYEKNDQELISKGGRIFITCRGIYRKNISRP